jgi:hypothetical protein
MSRSRYWTALSLIACLGAAIGCTAPPSFSWDKLKGPGFPGWTEKSSARAGAGSAAPKSSGFFTDRRSEQIEKDLGGF